MHGSGLSCDPVSPTLPNTRLGLEQNIYKSSFWMKENLVAYASHLWTVLVAIPEEMRPELGNDRGFQGEAAGRDGIGRESFEDQLPE